MSCLSHGFAWSHVWPFSYNTRVWQTDTQTHDNSIYRVSTKWYSLIQKQSLHEITAWKLRTVQPFLIAVVDFAILLCRRYGHAFCRRLGTSLFWLSPFWFVAVLTILPSIVPRWTRMSKSTHGAARIKRSFGSFLDLLLTSRTKLALKHHSSASWHNHHAKRWSLQ